MTRRSFKSMIQNELGIPTEALRSCLEIIGDIAVVKIPGEMLSKARPIGEAIMDIHGNVKTVLRQVEGVQGDWRLRTLEYMAGEKKTSTIHREAGCLFHVDLAQTYFSPRLQYERMRVAEQVQPGEIIVNMFSGVGCFSILIARKAKPGRVYSIDINPAAVELLKRNIALNRVQAHVEAILGDGETIVKNLFQGMVDRVLMPLPEKAEAYLNSAVSSLKPEGGIIHYYDFIYDKMRSQAVPALINRVSNRLRDFQVDFSVLSGRIVRPVGPHWYQIAVDIHVKKVGGRLLNDDVKESRRLFPWLTLIAPRSVFALRGFQRPVEDIPS